MTKKSLQVGVLTSTNGSYGTVGKTIQNGVVVATEELRTSKPHIELELLHANPGSHSENYVRMAKEMLDAGVRHIIGCYTSSSRKDLLPLMEHYDALLWYPTHYEGFESSDNVVYTGTSPNHHIHPMVDYMHIHHGGTAFCIGSDYIWAWESNRVFKDAFLERDGQILGEEYIPLHSLEMRFAIEQILQQKPAFILNTLIGASSYEFFRQFRNACAQKGIDQQRQIPVVSCNLSEADLQEIGTDAREGHFSSSVYFASVSTPENKHFVEAYTARYPNECLPTVEAEAAYIATHFLAAGLERCQANNLHTDVSLLKQAALTTSFTAPQGRVKLDPITFHTYLTPRIGRSNTAGGFDIVVQAEAPVKPDPYLVWTPARPDKQMVSEGVNSQ